MRMLKPDVNTVELVFFKKMERKRNAFVQINAEWLGGIAIRILLKEKLYILSYVKTAVKNFRLMEISNASIAVISVILDIDMKKSDNMYF